MPYSDRPVGQTKTGSFEIGVRKTFSIPVEQAWELLTSAQGWHIWLGDVVDMVFEPGERYRTVDGIEGEVRVVNPRVNIRLTWKLPEWDTSSTVQVRTIPSGQHTTISFHQEKLAGTAERNVMFARWQRVLQALEDLIHV